MAEIHNGFHSGGIFKNVKSEGLISKVYSRKERDKKRRVKFDWEKSKVTVE